MGAGNMKFCVVLFLLLVAGGFSIQGHRYPYYGRYHGYPQRAYIGLNRGSPYLGYKKPFTAFKNHRKPQAPPSPYKFEVKIETEEKPALRFSSGSLPPSLSSVSGLLGLLPSLTGASPSAIGGIGSTPDIEGTLTGSISRSLTGAIEGSISGIVSITSINDGKSRTTNYEIQNLEYTLSGGPQDATDAAKAIVRAAMESDGLTIPSGSISGTLNGVIIVSFKDEAGNVDSKTYDFDNLAYKVDKGDLAKLGDDSIAKGGVGAFTSALREIAGDLGLGRA